MKSKETSEDATKITFQERGLFCDSDTFITFLKRHIENDPHI